MKSLAMDKARFRSRLRRWWWQVAGKTAAVTMAQAVDLMCYGVGIVEIRDGASVHIPAETFLAARAAAAAPIVEGWDE